MTPAAHLRGYAPEIRPLREHWELEACVALQRRTWGDTFADLVPPSLLLATQEAGGIAAGAFLPRSAASDVRGAPVPAAPERGDPAPDALGDCGAAARERGDPAPDAPDWLVGFVFGLPGIEAGEPVHWSDMLAVRPGLRDSGIGERLKLWQRDVVLARGYRRMRWTFDPLESRNAWLNFSRLGATSGEYVPDMYADMDSPLHQGIGTDRLVVSWELDSGRTRRRLAGAALPPSAADVSDLPFALAAAGSTGTSEPPRPARNPRLDLDAQRVLVAIPADLQALKAVDAALALEWRLATRAAFEAYIGRGYAATELVRLGACSAYVLER